VQIYGSLIFRNLKHLIFCNHWFDYVGIVAKLGTPQRIASVLLTNDVGSLLIRSNAREDAFDLGARSFSNSILINLQSLDEDIVLIGETAVGIFIDDEVSRHTFKQPSCALLLSLWQIASTYFNIFSSC
jgi:hypothetical protein